jgi:hypothetical protein
MSSSRRNRASLPSINEISEEMLLQLRDHPEPACRHCRNAQGVLIGEKTAELYSIHYINHVSVYGCPHCFRLWYMGSGMELA